MGIKGQWVTVENAVMIWKVMVQSVLDYATEVFVDIERWEGAEVIARKMGKAILGVRKSTANEVVMGELGWWSMKGRRDLLRLLYWGEIVSCKEGLRWEVYKEGRRRGRGWCEYTEKCLRGLKLGKYWDKQDGWKSDAEMWRGKVARQIQHREQEEWRGRMQKKSKLRTYRGFKRKLERENYLLEGTAMQRKVMTMIRGGSNDLRIETGRWEKLEVEERVCIFCSKGVVEDERHFLCECEAWSEVRDGVIRRVREVAGEERSIEDIMFVIGGGRVKVGEGRRIRWREIVLQGVERMDRLRRKEWKSRMMGVGSRSNGKQS